MTTSAGSTLSYVLIRLFAVVGILLMLERSSDYIFRSYRSSAEPPPDWGLEPHAYKDGNKTSAFHRPSTASSKSKAIVAAGLRGDNTSWIQSYFPHWESNVYVMNDPDANMTVTKNKGNEASAYLTYLITHYHNLPEYMVFLHAKRYQWHNDDPMYDHVPVLESLRLKYVSDVGYTSLRCNWSPGCRVELIPDRDSDDGIFGIRSAYVRAFESLFPKQEVPREVGHPCCAQFAVSRDKVREKPVRHYEKVRQWIWESDLPAGRSGRIMEYMWHIVFGRPSIDCPDAGHCFCQKFGKCNLTCSDAGCENTYKLPNWDSSLPEKWPEEGQGEHGYPVDGWWKKQGD